MGINTKQQWQEYVGKELVNIKPILLSIGFSVQELQPHLQGERFLMRAVTTKNGTKLIILGNRISDGKKVVIKVTRDKSGADEIRHERRCRDVLNDMRFAYEAFLSPKEITFVEKDGYLIYVQEFIEQESSFLERPIEQQFNFALKSFKAQESAKASAYKHLKIIGKNFDIFYSKDYLKILSGFIHTIKQKFKDEDRILNIANKALETFSDDILEVEQYCGFLTHVDFVPHNIRISDDSIYLLDHSSMRFGNKHEGWARFLNFMALHNPELEKHFVEYFKNNRSNEENKSLYLMRIFRLAEITCYYIKNVENSSGDLRVLNTKRVHFWLELLDSIINGKSLDPNIRDEYISSRDKLRSDDEKIRQVGLL